MSMYINPPTGTKEDFLKEFGTPVPLSYDWSEKSSDESLVCWVNNGDFTAAGIIEDERDLKRWTSDMDGRPKLLFIVLTKDLKGVI